MPSVVLSERLCALLSRLGGLFLSVCVIMMAAGVLFISATGCYILAAGGFELHHLATLGTVSS